MAKKDEQFIYVKPAKNDGRVALAENDDMHPGGSAFVAVSGRCEKVGKTSYVMAQLREGILAECDKISAKGKKEAEDRAAANVRANPRVGEMVQDDEAEEAAVAEDRGEKTQAELDAEVKAAAAKQKADEEAAAAKAKADAAKANTGGAS